MAYAVGAAANALEPPQPLQPVVAPATFAEQDETSEDVEELYNYVRGPLLPLGEGDDVADAVAGAGDNISDAGTERNGAAGDAAPGPAPPNDCGIVVPLQGILPKLWSQRGPYAVAPGLNMTVEQYCAEKRMLKIAGRTPNTSFFKDLELTARSAVPGHSYPSTIAQMDYALGLQNISHKSVLRYVCVLRAGSIIVNTLTGDLLLVSAATCSAKIAHADSRSATAVAQVSTLTQTPSMTVTLLSGTLVCTLRGIGFDHTKSSRGGCPLTKD